MSGQSSVEHAGVVTRAGLASMPALPTITDSLFVLNLTVFPESEQCRSHRFLYPSRGACRPFPLTRCRRGVPRAFADSSFLRVGSM
ncbi:MAG TPA: hypothetical protein VFS96_05085 [Nitrolancea sp.]|nr:hypothetical protein [Nitrolancea sp.]